MLFQIVKWVLQALHLEGYKSRFNNHMNNKHNWKWADCGEGLEPWVQWRKCDKKLLRKLILVPKKVLPSKIDEVQPGGDQINCQFFLWQSNAMKQFFKIHVKSCQGETDDDDDIEVIKAVTADKSVER